MASESVNDDRAENSSSNSNVPFRFKSQSNLEGNVSHDDLKRGRKRRTHGHDSYQAHRSHRHKRAKRSYDTNTSNQSSFNASLAPDDAFQESLFDAMGDDEGAAYWQAVYGQPIHTYPQSYRDPNTGTIELMDDEQYAKYVRQQMWERSAEGINAAREARRQEKGRESARRAHEHTQRERNHAHEPDAEPYNNFDFDFDARIDAEIDATLRRGDERKERKKWQGIWKAYQNEWMKLREKSETRKKILIDSEAQLWLRDYIVWPVKSGALLDVSVDEVNQFIQQVISIQDKQSTITVSSLLKAERIRWHPDKIQQKFGFMEIDKATMAGVTATFQILDSMWSDQKDQDS